MTSNDNSIKLGIEEVISDIAVSIRRNNVILKMKRIFKNNVFFVHILH